MKAKSGGKSLLRRGRDLRLKRLTTTAWPKILLQNQLHQSMNTPKVKST